MIYSFKDVFNPIQANAPFLYLLKTFFGVMDMERWLKMGLGIRLIYVVRCAILYHLYNLKNVKNIHGGVLILVKLQVEACNY